MDCSDPVTTDAEDIVAAIEAMICGEGEELTRNDTGELVCFNEGLVCPYTQQIQEFYDIAGNAAACAVLLDCENFDQLGN